MSETSECQEVTQPPLNTSLLGVVAGAAEHFQLEFSVPELFVLSGHAFIINIGKDVCPSGPYCFDQRGILQLIRNVGIEMNPLDSKFPLDTAEHRAEIEKQALGYLEDEGLVSIVGLDHQLVKSFDGTKFHLTLPWGTVDTTPPTLTKGTWEEFAEGPPTCFYGLKRCDSQDCRSNLFEAMEFAVETASDPSGVEWDGYRIGSGAYEKWIQALESGNFEAHGHWWNASVWSENRRMASVFFDDLASSSTLNRESLKELSRGFETVADSLVAAASAETVQAKLDGVTQASHADAKCTELIVELST